jgi:hypothetical protein
MCRRLPIPARFKISTVLLIPLLAAACASGQRALNDEPYEPSFQERVAECSKIADRSERNRCLYGT